MSDEREQALAGDDTATIAPLPVAPAVFTPIEEIAMPAAKRKNKWPLIITLIVMGVLLLAAVSGFFVARWYFQDKAAPGVTFAGSSVAGQTREQLKDTVSDAVKSTTITIKDNDGNTDTAKLTDLGVTVNINKTVSNLLAAKHDDDDGVLAAINAVNPFDKSEVPLAAQTNELDLTTYVTDKFVDEDERAVASTISYDSDEQAFTTVEGREGRTPETDKVLAAVRNAINVPGGNSTASISYKNVDMPVSVSAAQRATDEANARLNNKIVLDNGKDKTFELPVDVVASWIKPNADLDKGTISLTYDEQAIGNYLEQEVPNQLNQDKVSQEDAVDSNGTVLVTIVKGVDGLKVKNVSALTPKVVNALQGGQGATIPVESDVDAFDTVQKKSEYRIVVDRASQTATVYQNDQAVRTFPVCTGTAGKHETDLGTYYIYLKYNVQDMTGLNDDGSRYLSKGVKWVGYFNGGEGFHTASWNGYGIAHGDPVHYGSHGCVNMYEADAKWIYDNCPEGTVVQVVGAMPSGAVR